MTKYIIKLENVENRGGMMSLRSCGMMFVLRKRCGINVVLIAVFMFKNGKYLIEMPRKRNVNSGIHAGGINKFSRISKRILA